MRDFAAIVLAGGAGRRLGGPAKPALPVGGRSMLGRVLGAVADAAPVVVVGKAPVDLPATVRATLEDPPGSGPVSAVAAGMALLPHAADHVAVLAADLPFLTPQAMGDLRRRLIDSTVDGVLYVDADGRRQFLCGVWHAAPLRAAIDRLSTGRGVAGASMRALLTDLDVREVAWTEPGPPPWFDCDTDEDLRQAEEWAR